MSVNAEALARARIPFVDEYYDRLVYERDTLGRFRLKPDQKLPHISINRQGYRGAEFSGQETALLLGDSVTFGIGTSGDNARFSRFWEQASGLRMADASVRAYRASQHFVQLPALLEQLPALKQVLVWCGFADLLYWAVNSGRIEGCFQMDVKYSGKPLWKQQVDRFLKRPEALALTMAEHGDIAVLVNYVMRYLNAIHDLCAARQIQMKILLQPFIRERPQDASLRAITDFYDTSTEKKCGIGWYAASRQFVDGITRVAQARKMALVDMQDGVKESDFFDQVHLREEAHQRLAQKGNF